MSTTTTICEDYKNAGVILKELGHSPGAWDAQVFAAHMECKYNARGAEFEAAVGLLVDLGFATKPQWRLGTLLSLTDEGVRLFKVGTMAEWICNRYVDAMGSAPTRYTAKDIREDLYSSQGAMADHEIIASALRMLSAWGHLEFDGTTAHVGVTRWNDPTPGWAGGVFEDLAKAFQPNLRECTA